MSAEEWKPTGFRLDTEDLSYLGQIWRIYTPDGEPVWRGVMTHFPGNGGHEDVAQSYVDTPDKAKTELSRALAQHRTERNTPHE
jgi:hypothetical protein